MTIPARNLLLRYRAPIVATIHVALTVAAALLAVGLRFDFVIPPSLWTGVLTWIAVLVPARLVALYAANVFRGSWRHVGFSDATKLIQWTLIASVVAIAAITVIGTASGMSRSVFVLEAGLFFGLAFGVRATARLVYERTRAANAPDQSRKTVVVGVTDVANHFVRQVQSGGVSDIKLVGLINPDDSRSRVIVHGVPVVGDLCDLPAIAQQHDLQLIVIAIAPDRSGKQMREIVRVCESTGVPFKLLPSLAELLDGRATALDLRDVRLEDLLGRRAVETEMQQVRGELCGGVVLVTGGAGSIGNELARQVARCAPRRLVLVEQAESPLYFAQLELTKLYPELQVVPVIGSVADRERMRQVFAEHQPDIVFHAAAYKHVPMMEAHPAEAVRNNVFGTLCVSEVAVEFGVRKFVLVSTDKAVNPSSVMGATKRLAELIVLGHPSTSGQSATDFRAVRFGNVLGSAGSVIPLFTKQLAAGGPLTVTDPNVRRFFMTIPEAAQLVLQSATLPEASGRVAMLEMGAPVRIVELAEQLIKLSGRVPYTDVKIEFTGLRPGEKLDEDLKSQAEEGTPTSIAAIQVLRTEGVSGARLQAALVGLRIAAESADPNAVRRALQVAVPEYEPRLNRVERRRVERVVNDGRVMPMPAPVIETRVIERDVVEKPTSLSA